MLDFSFFVILWPEECSRFHFFMPFLDDSLSLSLVLLDSDSWLVFLKIPRRPDDDSDSDREFFESDEEDPELEPVLDEEDDDEVLLELELELDDDDEELLDELLLLWDLYSSLVLDSVKRAVDS